MTENQTTSTEPEVQADNLSFSYPQTGSSAEQYGMLSGISFTAHGRTGFGIIGANGAGKSTLLRLIVGLETGYTGTLTVDTMPVQKNNLTAVRKRCGYVFQDSDSQLFMPTVYADVSFAPQNYGCSMEETQQRTLKALKDTHIEYLKDRRTYSLSGGEKKLASLASVLSMQPDILLLDEPSAALDPGNRRSLIHLLNGFPCLKLIASHDLDFIYDTCSTVLLLSRGKTAGYGTCDRILTDRKLLESNGLELPLSLSGRM